MEAANIPEDLNKDFLSDVGGLGGVRQAAGDQRIERLMILRDENAKGILAASLKVGDERGFFRCYTYRAGQISHERARLHIG